MPNQDQTNTPTTANPAAGVVANTAANAPAEAEEAPVSTEPLTVKNSEMVSDIASRIADAHNILIALSSDPSVDELAAAIGMSLCLDRVGKRATAIFSGNIPNALEFLKPEDTFETSADTLQDFVVALNKEKADHLRYKLDGDYVKIFITPYKTRIDEEDLEFSYGDFNIDLVIALDVANGVDLDSALREHGRIMHDATIINITTGNPGKLGEIEWSDKNSSSVSEMIARLLYSMSRKITIEPEDATAFLTGIVAATNHFSNGDTTPGALEVASALLKSGANQLLISENISGDFDNNFASGGAKLSNLSFAEDKEPSSDATTLDISHEEETVEPEPLANEPIAAATVEPEPAATVEPTVAEPAVEQPASPAMPEELQAVANSLASSYVGPSTPETPAGPTVLTSDSVPADSQFSIPTAGEENKPEKIVAPSAEFLAEPAGQGNKYGQMLEDALIEQPAPAVPTTPVVSSVPELGLPPMQPTVPTPAPTAVNPATTFVPPVPSAPELNGVPDMDFAAPVPPVPELAATEDILPPAPAPNFDGSAGMMPPMPPVAP